MLELANQLISSGCDAEELVMAINSRDLASMQKWVEYNNVSCKVAADDEESELSKRLRELKEKQTGKIVSFKDIKEDVNN